MRFSIVPIFFVALVAVTGTEMPAQEVSLNELVLAAKSGGEPARIKAIDALGHRAPATADTVTALTELLSDDSAKVRAHAAHALSVIGPAAKPAIEALAKAVKDDDVLVRRQAVKAIIAIHPGPQVGLPLFIRLMNDSDQGVQMRILDAITDAGPAALPGVINALGNKDVAYWACVVLRGMGPIAKDAVPALAKTVQNKNPQVQLEAILALGAIGEAAAAALPQLTSALDDKVLREPAVFAIGQIGKSNEAIDAKLNAFVKGDDPFLGTISLWTLSRVHPTDKALYKQAAERLVEGLKNKEPFVRATAARALATLPPAPEIALPILENALQGANEETVGNMLSALATLGPPAVPRLVDAIQHKNLRGDIMRILADMGPAAALATEPLSKLLTDDDTKVSVQAALTLARIGPEAKSAVPALIEALRRPHAANRHAIIFALGRIGPAAVAAQPLLVKGMQSHDRALASMCAWATTQIQPNSAEVIAKALPIIIASFAEPLPESRAAAAEALEDLGAQAKPAIPALEKAAHDKHANVRRAAQKALAKIQK
jgi:HEAT repeat protein